LGANAFQPFGFFELRQDWVAMRFMFNLKLVQEPRSLGDVKTLSGEPGYNFKLACDMPIAFGNRLLGLC
jgi:hypothetical protein